MELNTRSVQHEGDAERGRSAELGSEISVSMLQGEGASSTEPPARPRSIDGAGPGPSNSSQAVTRGPSLAGGGGGQAMQRPMGPSRRMSGDQADLGPPPPMRTQPVTGALSL